jgi:hypothetical protein
VKLSTTVTAVLASLVLASLTLASVPGAASAAPGPGPRGYDVSYPQCDGALPADQAFGIVAVNGGLANTTNPCLDDEISWAVDSAGSTLNRADLDGMVSYLRHIGASAGIYSTAKQFGPLMGTVGKTSPLYRLPDWIPGASTLAQAKKNCQLAPLTGGGSVTLTQWKTKPALSDYSCPPPPKVKGR